MSEKKTKTSGAKLVEYGYTPANYAKLVELTGLSPKQFYTKFDIKEGTFYQHRRGDRSLKWQEWEDLYNRVSIYLASNK